jgi:hypothetical protein
MDRRIGRAGFVAAYLLWASAGALLAQRGGGAFQIASVGDLGVQDAVKFAMAEQQKKEMVLLSALVSAERQTTPTATTYRLCLSVARGAPHEQATVLVARDAKQWTKMQMTSWTYGPCRIPAGARPQ